MADQSTPPVVVTPAASEVVPWWVKPALAAFVLVIFAGALGAMVKIGNDTQITSMVQAIIVLASGATGYFFGSSAGSDKKDTTNAALGAALATSTPAAPETSSDAVKALAAKVGS